MKYIILGKKNLEKRIKLFKIDVDEFRGTEKINEPHFNFCLGYNCAIDDFVKLIFKEKL